jgi:hypothetical protein
MEVEAYMKYYVLQHNDNEKELCVLQFDEGRETEENAYFALRNKKTILAKVSHDYALQRLRHANNNAVKYDGNIKYINIDGDSSILYMIPEDEYGVFMAEQKLKHI